MTKSLASNEKDEKEISEEIDFEMSNVPSKFDDTPDEEIIFKRNFGVAKGTGLMMIQLADGAKTISLSAQDAAVLQQVKRMLLVLNKLDIKVSELYINDSDYPEIQVKTNNE